MTNYVWMEKQLEQYEETLRESAADRVEERFEKLCDEVEERARCSNEHLHGAALDAVARKALRELREELEAEAEEAIKEDVEQFREHLLQQDDEE